MDPQTGSPAFGVALQADFCSSASKNSILFYIDHTATLIIARSTSKSSLTVGHEGHTGRRRHDARARAQSRLARGRGAGQRALHQARHRPCLPITGKPHAQGDQSSVCDERAQASTDFCSSPPCSRALARAQPAPASFHPIRPKACARARNLLPGLIDPRRNVGPFRSRPHARARSHAPTRTQHALARAQHAYSRARPTVGGPARRHHPQPDRLGEPQRGAGAADRDGGRAWQWRGTGRERGSGEGRGGARGRRGGTGRGRGSGRGCARSAQLGPVSRARTGERGLQNRSGPARTGTGTDGLGRAGTNAASRTGPGVSPAAARRIPRTAEEPGRARL